MQAKGKRSVAPPDNTIRDISRDDADFCISLMTVPAKAQPAPASNAEALPFIIWKPSTSLPPDTAMSRQPMITRQEETSHESLGGSLCQIQENIPVNKGELPMTTIVAIVTPACRTPKKSITCARAIPKEAMMTCLGYILVPGENQTPLVVIPKMKARHKAPTTSRMAPIVRGEADGGKNEAIVPLAPHNVPARSTWMAPDADWFMCWRIETLGNPVKQYQKALAVIILGSLVLFLVNISLKRRNRTLEESRQEEGKVPHLNFLRFFQRIAVPLAFLALLVIATEMVSFVEKIQKTVKIGFSIVMTIIRSLNKSLELAFSQYFERDWASRGRKKNLRPLTALFKFILWTVGIIFLLSDLGLDVSTAIAGLGVGGIAAAIAAQSIKRMLRRRVVFNVRTTYETPAGRVEKIPSPIKDTIASVQTIEGFICDRSHLNAFEEYSLNFETVYYVPKNNYAIFMDIRQEIYFKLFRAFRDKGIKLAYPTQLLYTKGGPTDSSTTETVPSQGAK